MTGVTPLWVVPRGDFRFVIRDSGSNFTASFDAVFQARLIVPASVTQSARVSVLSVTLG
jgi:hypothetical protein